jgi:hypothetical protein
MRIYLLENMPPTTDTFVEAAASLDKQPFTRAAILAATAALIDLPPVQLLTMQAAEEEGPEALVLRFLRHGLDAKQTVHLPARWREELVACRADMLNLLSDASHFGPQKRAGRAIDHFIKKVDILCGLNLLHNSGLYQFDSKQTWWRDGRFFVSNEDAVEQLVAKNDLRSLHKYGFEQMPQKQYRERLRPNLLALLFAQGQGIELAAIIHFYTGSLNAGEDHSKQISKLVSKLTAALPSQDGGYASIPMFPLYSLPRETHNLYRLSVADFEDEADTKVLRAGTGRAKLSPDKEDLILFDKQLIFKDSGHADQYMSVEMDNPDHSVLRALVAAIEKLELQPEVMEHLPRIVAGIFQAAWRDKNKPFTHRGAFWETESGRRICELVGFDPDNQRHRARVQQALFVLSRLTLHREIVYPGRKKKTVQWSGPIIQKLKDKIDVNEEDQEGVTSQQTFQEWLVAVELWDVIQPSDPVHSPMFMLIDRRAFRLDASDSNPFNLYWTIINRAYMDKSIHGDGSYSVSLKVLLEWAGIEHDHKKTKAVRLRAYLKGILERFVQVGLIKRWACDVLSNEEPVGFIALEGAQLMVWFDNEQLNNFPDYIFSQKALDDKK